MEGLLAGLLVGKATINSTYGTRVAVLVGDFLFAQSSWALANLDNLEVIKLISQVRWLGNGMDSPVLPLTEAGETEIIRMSADGLIFYRSESLECTR
jgi:hypothetical protein